MELNISQPSNDIFEPTTIISKVALEKLKVFCILANKSTGSSRPSDRERWFDFICQTVDDGKMFKYSTLANFLQDEKYWGKNRMILLVLWESMRGMRSKLLS